MIEKKLPGKGWEYMVYDKQDRLVATQDTELKKKGQWLYTKYDKFGRVAYTGISIGGSRAAEQAEANTFESNNVDRGNVVYFYRQGMGVQYGSSDLTYPKSPGWVTLLSLNYYDSYPQYDFNPAFPAAILGIPVISDVQNTSINTKNLPVMSFIKNIEDDNWTKNYVYYDDRGRAIGTYSINHLGGYTKTETELDFAGVPKQSKVYHKRLSSDTEKVITQTFEYDAQNRLKKQWHQVNSQPQELLSENSYNELSQLTNKKVGNSLQSIDYTYDIRGAVIKVNNPASLNGKLFGYELKYTNPSGTVSKYNGTIGEVDWKTANDNVLRRYTYEYDGLNRLKKAVYSEPTASVPQNGFYNETVGYDMNNNITSIKRNTGMFGVASLMDDLTYDYTGNRLNTVTDTSTNYSGYPDASGNVISYDDNGNMTNHVDKGVLQIDYNFLNLPDYVKFDTSYRSHDTSVIYNVNTRYTYRADGTKLRKVYTYGTGRAKFETVNITDYLDGFQYEGDNVVSGSLPIPSLKFVPTAEGYYNFENNKYIYSYTDHLGNVRLSYFKNAGGSAEALEENNYYPFGLKHTGYNAVGGSNPSYNYQYNGKELQNETGWSDYGARMYMADIGRWGVIDPLAETSRRFSPYAYALNNPISFIDPDGRKAMIPNEASDMAPQHPNSGWWMGITGERGDRTASTGVGRGGDDQRYGNPATFGQTQEFRNIMAYLAEGSPSFQFDKIAEKFYKENYSEFYNFVMDTLPKITGDTKFMTILSNTSGFSIEELNKMFKSDTDFALMGFKEGTSFSIADYPYGSNPKAPINLIRMDMNTLEWFKTANKDTKTIEGITNIVQMIGFISHEINHWGVSAGTNSSFRRNNLAGDPGDYFEKKLINSYQKIGDPGKASDAFNTYIKQNYKILYNIFNK
ncbi:RHS repeat-associated core domain-containing protein [Chryseobacterium sp. Tr-659]|nr:RHS repeat-associated core domain-containing protein [Chryseobacterium sp. Tr-659]